VREGHGARWLVEHGVVADYALVGEVSDFKVTVAQSGYLRLRIRVPGVMAYTPGVSRGAAPADNRNPFERAAHVIARLEAWARDHEETGRFTFWGGTLVPKAQVLEVAPAGPPWTDPEDACLVFFDVRLPPAANAIEIRAAIRAAVAETGIPCRVDAYDFKRGYVADDAAPVLDALRAAHAEILGDELDYAAALDMSMWRDANAFNEAAIPAIGYGPPTAESGEARGAAGAQRPVAIDDVVATAKVFALTALTVCGIASGGGGGG
jgi:acetylornithine deacetylase/succinyl-diaminopimelate desuccinylase-like protein